LKPNWPKRNETNRGGLRASFFFRVIFSFYNAKEHHKNYMEERTMANYRTFTNYQTAKEFAKTVNVKEFSYDPEFGHFEIFW